MPESSAIFATRTCPFPGHVGERELPFDNAHFYHRPNGNVDSWCRECVRTYNREQRARRREMGAQSGRRFGVEIEFVGAGRSEVIRELRARGLAVYDTTYTHIVTDGQWKVVTDGSVYGGFELVSPPLKGAAGRRDLEKACEALVAAGATVNRSCGLHVHHEVTDLNRAQFGRLFRLWHRNQAATDGLVASSRRGANTSWCRPLREDEVQNCENAPIGNERALRTHFSHQDRYRSLNVAAFPRYGTVEVRQHQGTINFKKIAAWVAFGQAFITWAKSANDLSGHSDPHTLIADLVANGRLSAADSAFLRGRAVHFGRQPVAA